ncbi:MAG: toxic anion resistance protein [Lachnospiraceae bacterium]|nr:toxic anion resistance protein [Lachnospiraceae bacterium]
MIKQIEQTELKLTEAEQKMVEEFSEKIDVKDFSLVLRYGAACQKKLSLFSDNVLQNMRTTELDIAGEIVISLMAELKDFFQEVFMEAEEEGFLGFLKKADSQAIKKKEHYYKVQAKIDQMAGELEHYQNRLLKEVVLLGKMDETNLMYFKELTMYIMAGKKKLEKERTVTLPKMQEKARLSGLIYDTQEANDFAAGCDRFEKKLQDLEVSRTISMQMGPQLRLIQNSNTMISKKIQSILHLTLPLWKKQIVLALGIAHTRESMETYGEAVRGTNESLKKPMERLKEEATRLTQEGKVHSTNEQLIHTLDEILRIQEEGRQQRKEAQESMENHCKLGKNDIYYLQKAEKEGSINE